MPARDLTSSMPSSHASEVSYTKTFHACTSERRTPVVGWRGWWSSICWWFNWVSWLCHLGLLQFHRLSSWHWAWKKLQRLVRREPSPFRAFHAVSHSNWRILAEKISSPTFAKWFRCKCFASLAIMTWSQGIGGIIAVNRQDCEPYQALLMNQLQWHDPDIVRGNCAVLCQLTNRSWKYWPLILPKDLKHHNSGHGETTPK